ncbi:hypothetical protein PCURB6_29630 [Paenibacillus curdlanolyticus]|nr:hypothetical protein PCURB6_29630 [Paenibacillus curdlanolyticus]
MDAAGFSGINAVRRQALLRQLRLRAKEGVPGGALFLLLDLLFKLGMQFGHKSSLA